MPYCKIVTKLNYYKKQNQTQYEHDYIHKYFHEYIYRYSCKFIYYYLLILLRNMSIYKGIKTIMNNHENKEIIT